LLLCFKVLLKLEVISPYPCHISLLKAYKMASNCSSCNSSNGDKGKWRNNNPPILQMAIERKY